MSLKRSTLKARGIDDEVIEEIIAAHSETVNSLKDEIDKYKEAAEKYKADAEKLPELQKRLDALENNHLQDDYDALKKEYEDFKNDVKNKETRKAKETAYRDMLKEAGISDNVIPLIIKATDFNEVELDRENNIKNKPDVAEKIKRDYDGFIVSQNVKTEKPETPIENKGSAIMDKKAIMEIADPQERQKAIAANMELFGYK